MSTDDGEGQQGEKTVLGHRPAHFPRTLLVAILMGMFGGVVTVVFIRLFEWVQHRLWDTLPDKLDVSSSKWYFIFPVVLVGAVLLGLARKHLGEYPPSIEEALEEHKKTGEFEYHHLWQATVISVISLGFGAALGPEAALTAIVGGIGSWIAQTIHANTTEGDDVSFIGISSALGALFGTAGAAVLVLSPHGKDSEDAKNGRFIRVLPGVLAALAGLYTYKYLGTSDHYFDLGLPDYSFSVSDLGWTIPVTLVSAIAGLLFLGLCSVFGRLVAPLKERPILLSVVGGIGLAALASWSSLVLFSGHEGVDTLVKEYGTDSVRFLSLIAGAKLIAAALLIATMWKGGRFFPTMFAGAAIGMAMTQGFTNIGEVVGTAAGMTAIVGVLVQRPVIAGGLMILFFQPSAWPIVIIAAILGSIIGKRFTPMITGVPAEGPEPAAA